MHCQYTHNVINSWFVFRRSKLKISVRRPAILTGFRGFISLCTQIFGQYPYVKTASFHVLFKVINLYSLTLCSLLLAGGTKCAPPWVHCNTSVVRQSLKDLQVTYCIVCHLGGVVVSVLAVRLKACGLKLGRNDGFLRAIKICRTPSYGWEIKPEVPCRKILRHIKDLLKSHGEG
jgi:hypothetical protein